ncbi:MAG: hypothetical protein WDW38_011553 [Sanguina aurantia]
MLQKGTGTHTLLSASEDTSLSTPMVWHSGPACLHAHLPLLPASLSGEGCPGAHRPRLRSTCWSKPPPLPWEPSTPDRDPDQRGSGVHDSGAHRTMIAPMLRSLPRNLAGAASAGTAAVAPPATTADDQVLSSGIPIEDPALSPSQAKRAVVGRRGRRCQAQPRPLPRVDSNGRVEAKDLW